jgi:TorA maturation chaperone TorD
MSVHISAMMTDPALDIAREALYRFAALTLLDPKCGAWEQLAALRDDLLVRDAAVFVREMHDPPEPLALGEQPPDQLDPAAVLERLPESSAALNQLYEATFGLLVSNACPPYETEYINSKFAYQRSNTLADVSGFYHAFGLTTSSVHPERADHVVQELEFMAFLIGLQRRADEAEPTLREVRSVVCRDAQARFLREHLIWWIPAFATLLGRTNAGGFYEAASNFLAALVACDRSLFGLNPATGLPAPSDIEQPEACDSCLLSR